MSNRTKAIFLATAALFSLGGFTFGFVACLHLKTSSADTLREQKLNQSGNAPSAIRASVVETLHTLQSGYAKRDPKQVDTFAQSLFSKDGDVLILGTNGGVREWVRGVPDAKQFIIGDWLYWGDVSFDADHAAVWSSGDVAWLATIGTVRWKKNVERPIRLSAILTREDNRWVFRQMHFQYDDTDPSTADLTHPQTYVRLLTEKLR